MANEFFLKRGDTYPDIETILADANGAVNLTGCTILFRMSVANTGNLMVEKPATIVLPQTGPDIGRVSAEFEDGDTDVVGNYRVEWQVTFPSGKIATFPRGATALFNQVIITDNVD